METVKQLGVWHLVLVAVVVVVVAVAVAVAVAVVAVVVVVVAAAAAVVVDVGFDSSYVSVAIAGPSPLHKPNGYLLRKPGNFQLLSINW